MIQTRTNHVIIFKEGFEGNVEKNCRLTFCSTEKDLEEILAQESADLVLVMNKWTPVVTTVREGTSQKDIPILILGKNKQEAEDLCMDNGCTGYVRPMRGLHNLCSKISQYLSLGNLLSTARRAYNKTEKF